MNKYAQLHLKISMDFMAKVQLIDDASSLSIKPSPSKWSKNEILGHLIDSAYNNHQRFARAKAQGNLIFQGYDQDDWVIKNDYQNRNFHSILGVWLTANQHMNALIERLPLDLLERPTTKHNFHRICMNLIPEGQPTSLGYLAWDYCFHLEHHISQILTDYTRISGTYETF